MALGFFKKNIIVLMSFLVFSVHADPFKLKAFESFETALNTLYNAGTLRYSEVVEFYRTYYSELEKKIDPLREIEEDDVASQFVIILRRYLEEEYRDNIYSALFLKRVLFIRAMFFDVIFERDSHDPKLSMKRAMEKTNAYLRPLHKERYASIPSLIRKALLELDLESLDEEEKYLLSLPLFSKVLYEYEKIPSSEFIHMPNDQAFPTLSKYYLIFMKKIIKAKKKFILKFFGS
jgi:hypothetical protein